MYCSLYGFCFCIMLLIISVPVVTECEAGLCSEGVTHTSECPGVL